MSAYTPAVHSYTLTPKCRRGLPVCSYSPYTCRTPLLSGKASKNKDILYRKLYTVQLYYYTARLQKPLERADFPLEIPTLYTPPRTVVQLYSLTTLWHLTKSAISKRNRP
jgi:hypothetical protein